MAILHSRLGQWLAGMAVLVALLALLAAAGALSPVEDAAAALFHPVQSALRRAAEPVANLVSSAGDFGALDDENRALRNRVEQLEAQVARLQEKEVRLRATDALQTVQAAQPNEIFLAAHVITRDLTGLRDIIGIDKGRSDGVQEGMPVLTDGGSLVGIVIEARAHISYVRLLTDPESSLRGRHQLSRTEGVIAADPGGTLRVDFIPQAVEVQPGQTFVTSGVGGQLPAGIPVGTVVSAQGSAQEPFTQIRLRPIAPLDQLETVLIQATVLPEPIPDFDPTALAEEDALPEPGAPPPTEERVP